MDGNMDIGEEARRRARDLREQAGMGIYEARKVALREVLMRRVEDVQDLEEMREILRVVVERFHMRD